MTTVGPIRPDPTQRAALRRTRARRVVAFAGMLTVVGGLVGLRAALTPPPNQALGSSGLAVETGGSSSAGGTSPTPRHASGGGSTTARRVIVGKAYDVSYGTVQVKVTITGSRITDVTAMSLPHGGRSGDISQFAAPQLRREALSAQSAHIDSVSGASYTSAGYAMSLQSALDQSGR
jgi:FMN-binding protein